MGDRGQSISLMVRRPAGMGPSVALGMVAQCAVQSDARGFQIIIDTRIEVDDFGGCLAKLAFLTDQGCLK